MSEDVNQSGPENRIIYKSISEHGNLYPVFKLNYIRKVLEI